MIRSIIKYFGSLLPKTRKSNPISKLLRPVFEKRKIRSYFGVQIAVFSVVMGITAYPTQAFDYPEQEAYFVDGSEINEVVTENTFQFPLEQYTGTSQGYHRFHPGVDLKAPRGTNIYPLTKGRVAEVEFLRYGYGHYVVVEHENELVTLYAHLGEVYVNVGQEVGREDVIGTVGMTGFTTGPHLHLEMIQENRYLSPKSVLREQQ